MASVDPNTSSNVNLALGTIGVAEIIVHYVSNKGIPLVSDQTNTAVETFFKWLDGLNSALGVQPDAAATASVPLIALAGLNWLLHRISSDQPGSLAK